MPSLYVAGILATFAREVVLAAKYGTGIEVEVFRLAFAIPNLLSTSLGPAFVAAVLPALMSAESDESRLAETVRGIAAVNISGVLLLTALAIVSSPLQARLLAPGYGSDLRANLTAQIAGMWLYFMFAGCSFQARARLSQRGILWPAAGATVAGAGTIALGCVLAGFAPPGAVRWSAGLLTWLAVVSGVLILLLHVVALPRGALGTIRVKLADWPGTVWAARSIGASVVLVAAYHLLSAVPRLIDRSVATTIDTGVVAALEYSFSLITVPGILLGTSLVTMLFPAFSKAVETGAELLSRDFAQPVAVALGLAALAGLAMSLSAPLLVHIVYARGSFDALATQTTAVFVRWHGVGLPFMVATIILAQAALAFRNYRLVILVGVARVLAKVVAVMVLVPSYGLSGLAASFIFPEAASAVILALALQRRLRPMIGESRRT